MLTQCPACVCVLSQSCIFIRGGRERLTSRTSQTTQRIFHTASSCPGQSRPISPGRGRRDPDDMSRGPQPSAYPPHSALLGCHVSHPLATPGCSALPQNMLSFITSQFSSGSVFWLQPPGLPTVIKCLCRKSSKAFQQKELGMLRTRHQGEHRITIFL